MPHPAYKELVICYLSFIVFQEVATFGLVATTGVCGFGSCQSGVQLVQAIASSGVRTFAIHRYDVGITCLFIGNTVTAVVNNGFAALKIVQRITEPICTLISISLIVWLLFFE